MDAPEFNRFSYIFSPVFVPRAEADAKPDEKANDADANSQTNVKKSLKRSGFTKEENSIIDRELEIHDLESKLNKNKREMKAMFKRYQELIALREQHAFK